jgi:hypothetical protein
MAQSFNEKPTAQPDGGELPAIIDRTGKAVCGYNTNMIPSARRIAFHCPPRDRGRRRLVEVVRLVGVVLWFLVVPAASRGQPQPTVEFTRERISIVVEDARIAVDGTYVLRNRTALDRVQNLFYPFPVDSAHPYPDSISVWQNREPLPFERSGNGLLFSVRIPAGEAAAFRVVYGQNCLDHTGCYILTTTAAWNRPLERAEFDITFGGGAEMEWATYDLKYVGGGKNGRTYEFTRERFMPDRDLCLRWKTGAPSDTSP